MKIDEIHLHRVRLPLRKSWQTAYGGDQEVETILIHVRSDQTAVWVETCPMSRPIYSAESALSAFHHLRQFFAPIVIGRDVKDQWTIPRLLSHFQGNHFAKAGLELCWWALTAKQNQAPLYQLIGGGSRPITIACPLGIAPSLDILYRQIQDVKDDGFVHVKLKIAPGWDVDVVQNTVKSFPGLKFQVDANCAYNHADLHVFKRLDDLGLEFIEQPFARDDLESHAALRRAIHTPVCLDESIDSLAATEAALRRNAAQIITIKVGRVGGLTIALDIHNRCKSAGIACRVGSMLESGIGTAINLALATLPGFIGSQGITLPKRLYADSLGIGDDIRVTAGEIAWMDKDSIFSGRVDEEVVNAHTVEKAVLSV